MKKTVRRTRIVNASIIPSIGKTTDRTDMTTDAMFSTVENRGLPILAVVAVVTVRAPTVAD